MGAGCCDCWLGKRAEAEKTGSDSDFGEERGGLRCTVFGVEDCRMDVGFEHV